MLLIVIVIENLALVLLEIDGPYRSFGNMVKYMLNSQILNNYYRNSVKITNSQNYHLIAVQEILDIHLCKEFWELVTNKS